MNRWQASVLAGLGLTGPVALADDVGWRPVTAVAPTAVVVPAHPVPFPVSVPTTGPATSADVWRPVTVPVSAAPPAPAFVSPPPPLSAATPTFPVIPVTFAAPPAAPAVEVPSVPRPMPGKPVEPAPAPRTAEIPQADVPSAAVPQPPGEPLPLPRVVGEPESAGPDATPAAPVVDAGYGYDPHAQRVWGVGGGPPSADGGVIPAGGSAPPVRHGAFGSKNLTLSRDHHFLDVFGLSILGDESDTLILGEAAATDRFFLQTEYLLWWVKPFHYPIIATTGPTPPNPDTLSGILGEPGTVPILGPGRFGGEPRSGFRTRAGAWLDHPGGWGIDGSFFVLGQEADTLLVTSNRFPVITRPIFAPNPVPTSTPRLPGEFGERVAAPGRSIGAFDAVADSFLWGTDLNLRQCVCRTCESRSEWFVGFRNVNLSESLTMTEYISAVGGSTQPVGTLAVVQDKFQTRNHFYGGQIGYSVGRTWDRTSFDARASVAIGGTHQQVEISGFQEVRRPGEPVQTFAGGLLAAGPNLGTFDRNVFSVVPELTLNAGFLVTPRLKTYVGYNILAWTNVVRPGDQIDRVVDLSFVPNVGTVNGEPVPFSGLARPQPTFRESNLWVQGVQFGLEYRW
ncbi:MAG: BBP7 family outer membrane beta-barrel protein [Fimbriiglobus sp.]